MTRRRHVPADKAASSALGSFYNRLAPEPVMLTCSRYGKKSATVRINDMLCIKCWMEIRAAARGEGSAAPTQGRPF